MKHLKTYESITRKDRSKSVDPLGEIEYYDFPYEPVNVPLESSETREDREKKINYEFPYEPMNVPSPSSETREERAKRIIDEFPYVPIKKERGDRLSREVR
jgi:hypothetical protein